MKPIPLDCYYSFTETYQRIQWDVLYYFYLHRVDKEMSFFSFVTSLSMRIVDGISVDNIFSIEVVHNYDEHFDELLKMFFTKKKNNLSRWSSVNLSGYDLSETPQNKILYDALVLRNHHLYKDKTPIDALREFVDYLKTSDWISTPFFIDLPKEEKHDY